jgi:hypothetical protein
MQNNFREEFEKILSGRGLALIRQSARRDIVAFARRFWSPTNSGRKLDWHVTRLSRKRHEVYSSSSLTMAWATICCWTLPGTTS